MEWSPTLIVEENCLLGFLPSVVLTAYAFPEVALLSAHWSHTLGAVWLCVSSHTCFHKGGIFCLRFCGLLLGNTIFTSSPSWKHSPLSSLPRISSLFSLFFSLWLGGNGEDTVRTEVFRSPLMCPVLSFMIVCVCVCKTCNIHVKRHAKSSWHE